MVLYPDVQKKARAELDTVIGAGRLPDFTDRAAMPYVECILKECLRRASFVFSGTSCTLLTGRQVAPGDADRFSACFSGGR